MHCLLLLKQFSAELLMEAQVIPTGQLSLSVRGMCRALCRHGGVGPHMQALMHGAED